jgi:plasmid replication initiation protein
MRPGPQSLVVQSNNLINTISAFSLQQKRFISFILASLPHTDEIDLSKDYEAEFSVKDFAEVFEDYDEIYRVVRSVAKQLMNKTIEWKEGNKIISVNLLSRQVYDEGNGRIEFKIDEMILPQILNLKKNYTNYKIEEVRKFSSVLTWRFFELIIQYKNIGKRYFDLDELREKLGISGKYLQLCNLEHKIIKKSIKEIEEKNNIRISYKKQKLGRKVIGIEFYIYTKENQKRGKQNKKVVDIKKQNEQEISSKTDSIYVKKWRNLSEKEKKEKYNNVMSKYIKKLIEEKKAGK